MIITLKQFIALVEMADQVIGDYGALDPSEQDFINVELRSDSELAADEIGDIEVHVEEWVEHVGETRHIVSIDLDGAITQIDEVRS